MIKKTVIGMLMMAGVVLAADWKSELERELPRMGHRNWVVVADAAYPLQTAPGIKTLYAGGDHIEVLQEVLDRVLKQKHVRPVIFVDTELDYVEEQYAAGINDLRAQIKSVLQNKNAQTLPHEEIIKQLDEAGNTFHVLLIKTGHTLPYTSVFLRLDCGYWSDEAESSLRKNMQ